MKTTDKIFDWFIIILGIMFAPVIAGVYLMYVALWIFGKLLLVEPPRERK